LAKLGGNQPSLGALTGIGLMLGLSATLGFFLGRWLDDRWHTTPWLSLVGLFIGLGAGFVEIGRLLRRFD